MSLPVHPSVHTLLSFLEFLYANSISHKVLLNYISSLKMARKRFGWDLAPFSHHLVGDYLRSVSINSSFSPTPRGIFDLSILSAISRACDILQDPPLFRAAFLLAFFAFLRMSNIAPHSRFNFDKNKHILRKDILFQVPTFFLNGLKLFKIVRLIILCRYLLCPTKHYAQFWLSRTSRDPEMFLLLLHYLFISSFPITLLLILLSGMV